MTTNDVTRAPIGQAQIILERLFEQLRPEGTRREWHALGPHWYALPCVIDPTHWMEMRATSADALRVTCPLCNRRPEQQRAFWARMGQHVAIASAGAPFRVEEGVTRDATPLTAWEPVRGDETVIAARWWSDRTVHVLWRGESVPCRS